MSSSIKYENDYIVGGSANSRLSPNFKVKEFTDASGTIFVHRELIAGLQILRNRYAASISVHALKAPGKLGKREKGQGVQITADDPEKLEQTARKLKSEGYFSLLEKVQNKLYVEILDPQKMPAIEPELAFDCGVQVTAAYETSGDPYQQVTGNFDGAGLSYGPIQCNFKSGTLQDLFRRFRGEDEAKLKACFSNEQDYKTFWKVIDGSISKAIAWGNSQSTGSGKHGIKQPWKGYLQCVGRQPLFRQVMLRYAYDKYGKRVLSTLTYLQGISPIEITNLRCLAAIYDMCVQQGSISKAKTEIRNRVFNEMPQDEFALTRIVVEERAMTASTRWRADCLSRRLSILERRPVQTNVSGQKATRGNAGFYLLRNSSIKNLDTYLEE